MTDNQLYTYFKSNTAQFDESPGDDLWTKIESELNTKPVIKYNYFLFIGCGIVILAGILFYISLHKKETLAVPATSPQIKQSIYTKPTTDRTTKNIIHQKADNTIVQDSVKKIRFKVITAPTVKPVPFTAAINRDSVKKADILKTAFIKIQNLPGKVIITTTGILSPEEFNELTTTMTEQHKNESGKIVIIKAPGYKPFRKIITPDAVPLKLTNNLILADSTIRFLESDPAQKSNNGKIEKGFVKFMPVKDDSISQQKAALKEKQ